MNQLQKFTWVLISLISLSACQKQSSIKPIVPQERVDLSASDAYQFSGKMSFSDGQDGGSGRITWAFNQGLIDATLKAPLGSKSWQVIESNSGATLISSNGEVLTAPTAEELISSQLGWPVPWQPLSAWVLGQQYNLNESQLVWGKDNFTINEDGWCIEYSKLQAYRDGIMAHKMVARKNGYSIKLAVKSWQW